MTPGNPQILTCPFCGEKKEIMTLASGNTFGAELWSDNKRIAPMLPEISLVQKCPKCGKYYIRTRQKVVQSEKGWCFEKGILSFGEMKEAFHQLQAQGFEDIKEEINIRMMLHHAYNDYYHRNDTANIVNEEDRKLFHENGLWLIKNLITDNVMKAEFYREIGEMETAKSILNSIHVKEDFLKNIADEILSRIKRNDNKVFRIQ
jgi:predicted RNA-binding Zn-ribbon protein involved in translation (DUF1610 family)